MTAPMMMGVGGRKGPPDQAARRADLKIPDQHGRMIHVIYDRLGNGTIQCIPLFKAPWIPHISYLEVEQNGSPIPTAMRWNYQKILAENHAAWDRWFDEFRTIGGRMPGVDVMAAYEAAKQGAWHKVPPALLAEIGSSPDPDDYVKAAMAGNSWVLGKSNVLPKWAEPLEKLKEARRRREALGVTEDDLDKYRDDADTDWDDEAEARGLGGGVERIPSKRVGRPPKLSTTPTE